MNKILVPTDFSEGAFNALIHAIHLAKQLNASVHVVHAYSMPATGSNVMVDITDILQKNAEEELHVLEERVNRLELSKDVTFSFQAAHGSVVDVVNRLSEKEDIDLVVMGTQGASGITEKWLGSNTAAAARNVKKPLIAIPAEQPFKTIETILFATDLKVMKNPDPLKAVAHLSSSLKAQVKFVHVRNHEGDTADQEKEFRSQIDQYFTVQTPVFSFVYDDEVEEGLDRAIKQENPSLMVVVRHNYGFFENLVHSSVSRKILNNAALPILVVNG